jgi:phosphonate transport system permease protein
MSKELITKSGKIIKQPFNKIWIIVSVFLLLSILFWQFIIFDYRLIRLNQLSSIVVRLFTPGIGRDWNNYLEYMWSLRFLLIETINMSFAGTIIGSLFAIPIAILAAKNITKFVLLHQAARLIMNLIRTIPAMILALLAVFVVGTGVLSGIIAMTLFTFGIMSKMLYEIIETIDMNPHEALESTGANKAQAFRFAVIPQILPIFVSYLIYIFEINIRSSAVLGYVGAGGIGSAISGNILYNYDRVGGAIIVMLITILVVQFFSIYLRGKLQ